MKNIKKTVISVMVILIFTSVNVSATENSSEKVFPKEEINQLLEEVHKTPIEMDSKGNLADGEIATRSTGSYPTRKGVILVTADAYKGLIPTGHAGIIYNAFTVVESTSKGVVTGKNNWNKSKKTCYGVSVRSTTSEQDRKAADWCYNQLKKPYNYNFLNIGTRKEFYCSQLVWAAFKDKYGIDLNTKTFGKAIHPLELVTSSKTSIIYEK
ncbi:MAG: YiiX/YebB-like N1pC/P60 family cysteine hydrolase [Bacillota bacterium]|nr:YiiX/YebB-like N1pC/P60 family cysteine hydrolase [Bacillota bacterium]